MGVRELSLDTETTGYSYDNGDRIVEIGIVELIDRKPTGRTFQKYVDPGFELSDEVVKIHGLTREQLIVNGGGQTFKDIADELIEFINGDTLIIHNAAFDMDFLDKELAAINRPKLSDQCSVFDTLRFAGLKFPGSRNSLDALCRRYGIDNSSRDLHGALLDAKLLSEVYLSLTRQQNDLNLDWDDAPKKAAQSSLLATVDRLEAGDLPVVTAQGKELEIHNDYLRKLVERSAQPPVWAAPPQPEKSERRRYATPAPF